MGKYKRIVSIALALLLTLSLASCGATKNEGETGDDSDYARSGAGYKVKAPADNYYLVENPLTIINVPVFPNGEPKPEDYPTAWEYMGMSTEEQKKYVYEEAHFNGSYIQISGLKDKAVEDKINERLKEQFLEYVDYIPPYRGIKALIGETPEPLNRDYYYPSVNMWVQGSYNNILSVVLEGSKAFMDISGTRGEYNDIIYASYCEPLNIDLNTGEEIKLESLICDNVDPYGFVNEKVKEYLVKSNADEENGYMIMDLHLAGQFDGIKPDQKFMLQESGIFLIFDYDTPEFMCDNFYYSSVNIGFSEELAITERFYKEGNNIYESDEGPIKVFTQRSYMDSSVIPIKDDYHEVDGITVVITAKVSDSTPDVLRERVEELVDISDDEISERFSPYLADAYLNRHPDNSVSATFGTHVGTEEAGPYVTIRKNMYAVVCENGYAESKFYYDEQDTSIEVYDLRTMDRNNPKPIELSDLFRDGVDTEKVIKNAITKALNKALNESSKNDDIVIGFGEGEPDRKYVDMLYDSISEFGIYTGMIYLIYDDAESLFCEAYGLDEADEMDYSWTYINDACSISFSDLGYENLAVFDR